MTKSELSEYIRHCLPFDSKIEIRNKNNYLVNVRKKIFSSEISIHPVFLKADKNILTDLVNYINHKKEKPELAEIKKRLSSFFEVNHPKRKTRIKEKFNHKNIFAFFEIIIGELKLRFPGIDFSSVKISWGKNYRNNKRSIRFGSFDKRINLVRIHPKLDDEIVPDHFIKSIIYHEIAHFIIFYNDKKAMPHSAEFKKTLKEIDPDYRTSFRWEKLNKKFFFS